MIPVILAGGTGSRLWPLSRKNFPKQLMPVLGSEYSLLQETVRRVMRLPEMGRPVVVTNEKYRFIIASQLQAIGVEPESIVLEPVGRSTAPAAAIGSLLALQSGGNPDVLLLPADHYVQNVESFLACLSMASGFTENSGLVTFGIVPDKPETGYGYIKRDAGVPDSSGEGFFIDSFVEKPDLARAEEYVASGNYYWNSGMFLFKAETYLKELDKFEPEMVRCCKGAIDKAHEDLDFLRLDKDSFARCPEDSIDYAVMEKTSKGIVVPLDCGWSDVGSWSSLYEVRDKDESSNVSIGDVMLEDSTNCYMHSSERLVAGVGLDNIAVVESKDAVLVSRLDKVQDVKKIFSRLKKDGRNEYESHTKVYRPWGNYESIGKGDRYQVKRIIVFPGQTLSLQKHYHRAEHWVVVKGTAVVTRDDEEMVLTEDQSTYIPLCSVHRLHNPGKVDLELIEVQTGSYLGEDDIERMEDLYGRMYQDS
ncbi:mannose-1-phosphate guanylyltransferase/mannose-6-phosphate isomerase [Maridesulfovibrio salexigens]|uniref:mannose-1-phosphate guanylyltransferase n=1 Tax=Maridesulfovibrio salexigens (strain ATCC 14822 / DSM 2638 / NCIMB 8403 / VKM B-1763) TaxID=526222 RepID=C6BXS5_MARSD|nr:mannose-1-phosphate guanylyltransferase/mannose-6-phosphate isomerase [Maridesulfovibrio salexigens]ACS78633.1 mannose-1-phosphate guanylyltransferase/mannose-6-phosphate isomerase [Maridesulfovibrio salexigens DSM 2638]